MADAMIEIEPRLPKITAREAIELRARNALGKHRARDGDMALEHAREMIAQLF